jgi:hypothetical protein
LPLLNALQAKGTVSSKVSHPVEVLPPSAKLNPWLNFVSGQVLYDSKYEGRMKMVVG